MVRVLIALVSFAITFSSTHANAQEAEPVENEAALREAELKAHEKSLEEAKAHLELSTANAKIYRNFLAGQGDPALRKKILEAATEELTATEKRKGILETRIKYYSAQIAKGNQQAKMWDRELREYNLELPHVVIKIGVLRKAIKWLGGGSGKPTREVAETALVKSALRQVKIAEKNVKVEEAKIVELKQALDTPSE